MRAIPVASLWSDQAAGLRAMIAPTPCRSISLNGGRGGSGTTTLAINLAAALAERNREVILLDEFTGMGNAAHRMRLEQKHELDHVLRREVTLADTLLATEAGFSILPISAKATVLSSLNERELTWLSAEFEQLTQYAEFLLLDTRPSASHGVPCLSLAADDVMVIVSNSAESLTDAYATIKLLGTEYARRDFRILVNRVDTITEAGLIFNRLKSVAKQYLGDAVQMKLIGYVPEDEKLKRASRLGRTVLDAFPDADSSHAFRQLADVMLRWRKPIHSVDSTGFLYRLVESSRLLTEQLQH